ncbi:DUF2325 domain-containing protein [Bacillus toyonensis]|uniref:DUF2325 domain-containing protein n=1 Tax=Bacillus cereus group TaxID=86661 RepID=UPI000BF4486A|nr:MULTISPECIES: DUF2325 domain-containing protein [Bacillus cereus group]PEQ70048.1 DUF2325 domain-containing protein [Bacillus thuringiensis]PHD31834.1 DUF2325 domain-containing protein [Bacillus toyonensis]
MQFSNGLVKIKKAVVDVENDFKCLCIRKTLNGKDIRLNGVPQTIILPMRDIRSLEVKKGDVIDLSFQRNQLQSTKKICIKYQINKDTNKNQESKKYKKSKIKMNSNNIDKVFKGLTLVMVGMEPEESELREAVEKRGGKLICISGKQGKSRRKTVRSRLSEGDIVVFTKSYVSHAATNLAVSVCKELNIPFDSVDGFGKSNFLRTAEKLIHNLK